MLIPLDHDPGEARVDWGEAQVYLDGIPGQGTFVLSAFVLLTTVLCHGLPQGAPGSLFRRPQGRIPELVGVPKVIVHDDRSTAVERVLAGSRREEQRAFIAFRSHHLFESSFCRPGEAHEKGMVENLVGYVRRNFPVPLPSVASFEELNAILRKSCGASLDRQLRGRSQTVALLGKDHKKHRAPI